jgi:thiamine monophosphate kinase
MAISAPGDLLAGELFGLCDGMVEAAQASGLALVGGDTTAAPLLILTATVLGNAGDEGLARRDSVHSGDRVLVTGQLGEAMAGLEVLQAVYGAAGAPPNAPAPGPRSGARDGGTASRKTGHDAVDVHWLAPISPLVDLPVRWRGGAWRQLVESLSDGGRSDGTESEPPALDPNVASRLQTSLLRAVRRFLRPRAQLQAGPLARRLGATAMIDISDGLASELHHLAAASGVGFRITSDWIPVGRGARAWGYLTGRDPFEFALGGGDDYELLFTAPPQWVSMIAEEMQEHGIRVSEIGEAVDAGEGLALVGPEGEQSLRRRGYQHFGRRSRRRRRPGGTGPPDTPG